MSTDSEPRLVQQVLDLIGDADFHRAAEVLDRAPQGDAELDLLRGRVDFALSRYDDAERRLVQVQRHPEHRAAALALRADIAWVRRDYAASAALARGGLALGRTAPRARHQLERALDGRRFFEPAAPGAAAAGAAPDAPDRVSTSSALPLAHVAFHARPAGNFGDMALPVAVQQAHERDADRLIDWRAVHVHHAVDEELLERLNDASGIVVGGGGLILPDTMPNGVSGWQWNVPTAMLRRIRVPLSVFGVGWNLFPGQRIAHPEFAANLAALAERAVVVGMRNTGSVEQVRAALPPSLREKVRYSPCPTTVLSRLLELPSRPDGDGPPRVLLNVAFDRAGRRFADGYEAFVRAMAEVVAGLERRGASVAYAAHLPADERFVTDLADASGTDPLPIERLHADSVERGYARYRNADLVIGMRGHATMIPFGLGTPVISLVSHAKMRWFLDDLGRPEWGVDVGDPGLAGTLLERASALLDDADAVRADIQALQERLDGAVHDRVGELLARV